MHDPVTERCLAALIKQRQKGITKYPVGLEDAQLTLTELVDHAIEEAADKLAYLTELRVRIEGLVFDMQELEEAMKVTEDSVDGNESRFVRVDIQCDMDHLKSIIAKI